MNYDDEHLRLLSIFHYIHAAMVAVYSLFALFYVAMGLVFMATPTNFPPAPAPPVPGMVQDGQAEEIVLGAEQPAQPATNADPAIPALPNWPAPGQRPHQPPKDAMRFMGVFIMGVGLVFLFMGLAFALASFLTGRFLARRQHRTFCIVVSVIDCLSIPIGTLLGVFSLIVLFRPTVVEMFAAPRREGDPAVWS